MPCHTAQLNANCGRHSLITFVSQVMCYLKYSTMAPDAQSGFGIRTRRFMTLRHHGISLRSQEMCALCLLRGTAPQDSIRSNNALAFNQLGTFHHALLPAWPHWGGGGFPNHPCE